MEGGLTALLAAVYGFYAIASISNKDISRSKYIFHALIYSALALLYLSEAFDLHLVVLAMLAKLFLQ